MSIPSNTGLWKVIVEKAFKGNIGISKGVPNIITKTDTGAPAGAAPVGTLCWNTYDTDAYVCTVASGTWVKINA